MDEQSTEQWKKIIEEQEASGESPGKWCKDHNIPDSRFYWWRRKLYGVKRKNGSDQKEFIELNVPSEKTHTEKPSALLKCGNLKLVIFPDTDERTLEKVVRVMMRNA